MVYYIGDIPCDSNYLAHYGIAGQKWGNRRFQNSDGSLTAAGRARYGVTGTRRSGSGSAATGKRKVNWKKVAAGAGIAAAGAGAGYLAYRTLGRRKAGTAISTVVRNGARYYSRSASKAVANARGIGSAARRGLAGGRKALASGSHALATRAGAMAKTARNTGMAVQRGVARTGSGARKAYGTMKDVTNSVRNSRIKRGIAIGAGTLAGAGAAGYAGRKIDQRRRKKKTR